MGDISKKQEYVKTFQEKLEKSKVVVLSSIEGVTVGDMNELRKSVRETGSEIKVVKNTLVCRALDNLDMGDLNKHLTGSVAVTFGYDDPVSPVKALIDFAGKCKKFQFKAGMLGGSLVNTNQLIALSKLPGRQELLSMLASVMQAPIRKVVNVLQAPIRKFVSTLDAVREKKEKEAV